VLSMEWAVKEEVGGGLKVMAVAFKGGVILHPPVVTCKRAPTQEEFADGVIPSSLGPDGSLDELQGREELLDGRSCGAVVGPSLGPFSEGPSLEGLFDMAFGDWQVDWFSMEDGLFG